MTSPEYSSHFSLANIPFGVASSTCHPNPQCVTRLQNNVIFLDVLHQSGVFAKVSGLPKDVFNKPVLNEYAALSKQLHREVRKILQTALKEELPQNSIQDVRDVTLHLPVAVGGFTDLTRINPEDFSCSLHHVQRAGKAIINDERPPPGFFNFPIGYSGRASTIVVSGTPIIRPKGHFFDRTSTSEKKPIIYGPSRVMDWELEMGFIVGQGVSRLEGVNAKDADENIFARDIQGCEMIPLGPLNGKAFGTSISPWIVTLDALAPFATPGPKAEAVLASHLEDVVKSSYEIDFKVELIIEDQVTTVSESKLQDLHWSGRQMCAHLASSGADLRTGDILGTGTISGPDERSMGCLLEITSGGKEPLALDNGEKRHMLQDWDTVRMTAVAGGSTSGVGFGECVGQLQPAR
ncbi:hypothetical protein N7478_007574 [Penicillium angulare]|uniref:uncharacterized protein n=1 Tax=Penicillium angulare TaxID=116970 RepID=UPI0025407AE3|nr:uncharacterized protein N7478_007574 [Penicillium angulare]KAJ5272449.1 hypothetical protein N7478_007574 [Penicillium angulare]